jgi:hypothetical protein
MIKDRRAERETGEDYRFTPKKVLIYCIIVGVISAILSNFIDWLGLFSMVALYLHQLQYSICWRNFIDGKREEETEIPSMICASLW